MKKLLIVVLACAVAFVGTTQAAQPDPNKKKAPAKPVTKTPATKQHVTTNTNTHVNHVQGQGTTHNNANVNKTTFHQTNKTVNNNKTVNKVQVNNKVTANTKVTNLHTANAGNWSKIHQQHQNFHATANTHIASAKFNAKYHIAGAQNWHGHQYVVFQNYHPMWHDHFWWHDHFHNVLLFGGGWYYWNSGYWYPAWGYSDSEAYYPYDGPIYVGSNPTPADQIVATVQQSLQEQGFYHGDVDGLLGPLTRAALADYQQAQGLEMTAALDEPTLQSLGMS
jgi:putative peptidoglycan binding protein